MKTRTITLNIVDFYDVLESIGIHDFSTATAEFDARYIVDPAEYVQGYLAVQANVRYYDAKLVELYIDGTSVDFTPIQASVLEVALEDEIVLEIESAEGV